MSVIVSEVYDALIEAGATKETAKAAAAAIPPVDRLANREDVAKLEREMATTGEHVSRLEREMATKEDVARLEREMVTKADFATMDKKLAVLNLAVFGFFPPVLALLVKLVFFP